MVSKVPHSTKVLSYDFLIIKIIKMLIEKIKQVPQAALDALVKYSIEEFDVDTPIEDMDELIDMIIECGKRKSGKDSYYINTDWTLDIGDWKFIASGSEYLKDHCICDMEMSDSIEVIDVVAEKLVKKLKKSKEAEIKAFQSKSKWVDFFEGKSKEEIIEYLMKCEFPNTL